jgi:hypothetical protein
VVTRPVCSQPISDSGEKDVPRALPSRRGPPPLAALVGEQPLDDVGHVIQQLQRLRRGRARHAPLVPAPRPKHTPKVSATSARQGPTDPIGGSTIQSLPSGWICAPQGERSRGLTAPFQAQSRATNRRLRGPYRGGRGAASPIHLKAARICTGWVRGGPRAASPCRHRRIARCSLRCAIRPSG